MAKAADYPLSAHLGTIGRALHVLHAQGNGFDPLKFMQIIIDDKDFRDQVIQLFNEWIFISNPAKMPEVPNPEGLALLQAQMFGDSMYKKPEYALIKEFVSKFSELHEDILVLTFGLVDGTFRNEATIGKILDETPAYVANELLEIQARLRNMLADHRHQSIMIATDGMIGMQPIEELGLRKESVRLLKNCAIHTTLDLCMMTEEELFDIPEFWVQRVIEVKEKLGIRGLGLRPPHRY